MRTVIVLALAVSIVAALSACGGSAPTTGGPIDVVAAENAYGNIAAQIGGSHVSVTSILTDPNADPHLFEPGTATGLAVSNARVVIQNGLGYDDFMTKLENASPTGTRVVVTVADVLHVSGKDANPHLWYDVPRLAAIANAITTAFMAVDPAHRLVYRTNGIRFDDSLAPLQQEVAKIRSRFGGAAVAYTEPVPGYLVAAAGLRNLAPTAFTRAIENGSEPTPGAVSEMNALVAQHRIRVLLYNSQTVSPITEQLVAAARRAGIGVVAVSETLPANQTFQQWQLHQTRALAAALAK